MYRLLISVALPAAIGLLLLSHAISNRNDLVRVSDVATTDTPIAMVEGRLGRPANIRPGFVDERGRRVDEQRIYVSGDDAHVVWIRDGRVTNSRLVDAAVEGRSSEQPADVDLFLDAATP
jgi:hypothetical protein